MLCTKCGNHLEDNAVSCSNCGAIISGDQNAAGKPHTHKPRKRKIGMLVIAIIVAAVAITTAAWFTAAGASDGGNPGTPSYKDTIGDFVQAIRDGDARSLFQLIPAEMVEHLSEEKGVEKRELIDSTQELMDNHSKALKSQYGETWQLAHEITDTLDLEGEELLQIQTQYEEIGIEVKEAKIVGLILTLAAEDYENQTTTDLLIIKVGGSWYLTKEALENIF